MTPEKLKTSATIIQRPTDDCPFCNSRVEVPFEDVQTIGGMQIALSEVYLDDFEVD